MTTQTLPAITHSIHCQLSGLPLANLEVLIYEGHLAYLGEFEDSVTLHPFYKLSCTVLIKKLEHALHHYQESGFILSYPEQNRLRLLVSAMVHSFNCLKQESPTLPSFPIAAASAGRLLGLSKWFYYVSSQRLDFPLYSVSKKNQNLEWENFRYWLDAAYKVRETWATKSREYSREAQQRAAELSLKEIRSESVLKRIDIKKVWNWITLQLEAHYPEGRLATFQSLFLEGDINAHDWIEDDVDDLVFALDEHCDQENTILFFIKRRLSGIRALIQDFRSSFSVIKSKAESLNYGSDEPTPQENAFFAEFDEKAAQLETLPPAPKRDDFATNALFLKAQAYHNILSRRKGKTT